MNLNRCRRWAKERRNISGVCQFDAKIDGEKIVLEWRGDRFLFVGFVNSDGYFSVKFLNDYFPQLDCNNLKIRE